MPTSPLAIRPGTNMPLLNAMAHVIIVEGLCDRAFLDARVDRTGTSFATFVAVMDARNALRSICGVDADAIRQAARLYARERPVVELPRTGGDRARPGHRRRHGLVNLALITGQHRSAGERE